MTRFKSVFAYTFNRMIRQLAATFIIVLLFLVAVPLFFAVISGTLSEYSIMDAVRSGVYPMVVGWFLIVIGAETYPQFKMMIQNGVSRLTYWRAKVCAILLITFIGTIFNLVYNWVARFSISGIHLAYSQFFTNPAMNILVDFGFEFLILTAVAMTAMAVGSILSLFSRRGQFAWIFLTPIALIVLLIWLINFQERAGLLDETWIVNFLKFLLGFRQQFGHYNPLVPEVTLVIYSGIMAAVSRFFFGQLKIKK
ncbi:hypothetical protein [Levilactobacillus bambusae]|uniref:Uncharacterized protein n=1 Tax=Levilactobacillus bambusae TaxID=2024736 RepID=A0A2V1MXG8_9LACO|nr:hypothetical protein [Levilactobacillus bambusae]PWF99541.1 hypothetical protein DCM90_08850 [Levilactobacillus bambusae]